jgi:signal transduction histidine kinase
MQLIEDAEETRAEALEAAEEGEAVKVWVEIDGGPVTFCVWNRAVIPAAIRLRLFQRNFSTKAQSGRGIGTYSMKLFGEEVLGGRVGFTSSRGEGTTFRFVHPSGE